MITKIDHIGIAVKDLDEHIPFYRDILKLEMTGREELAEQEVKVAMFKAGEITIELLESISEAGPIARYIEKKGEGMHHIAYRTDDIQKGMDELKKKGIVMIDQTPRKGAHGSRIAFIHPRSSCKVLTELIQG